MSAPFATLVDYWFGELPASEEAAFEEHLFGCGECTAKLEDLEALGAAVRAAWREGAVRAVISRALFDAMKKEGLRLREYRLQPGGSVNCTIASADDFVVSRLSAPLQGVRRLDLITTAGRFEDVPFDAEAGEVLVCPAPALLKKKGAYTHHMRLVAVEDEGERVLGDYAFSHSPS
jgi:putative zinc finger protein